MSNLVEFLHEYAQQIRADERKHHAYDEENSGEADEEPETPDIGGTIAVGADVTLKC